MSYSNITNLIKGFKEYLSNISIKDSSKEYDIADNSVSIFSKYSTEFKQFFKDNASSDIYSSIFADGKFDNKDIVALSNFTVSSSGKIEKDASSDSITKNMDALNEVQKEIQKAEEENANNLDNYLNNNNSGSDSIVEQIAKAMNMSVDELNKMTQEMGLTGEQFALSVYEQDSNEAIQESSSDDKSDNSESDKEVKEESKEKTDIGNNIASQEPAMDSIDPNSVINPNNILNPNNITDPNAIQENIPAVQETQQSEETVESLLDEIFNDAKGIKALDTNKNGKLSSAEMDKFKEYVRNGNEEIDIDDLKKAYDLIKKGKFDYNKDLDGKLIKDIEEEDTDTKKADDEEVDDKNDDNNNDSSVNNSSGSSGGSSVGGSSGGGGTSPAASAANNNSNAVEAQEDDSYEVLVQKQADQQEVVKNDTENLEKAKTDGEKEVEDKKKAYDDQEKNFKEAEDNYRKAMEEDKYLKTPEGQKLKVNIEKNLTAIAKAEAEESEKTQEVAEKETALTDAKADTRAKKTAYCEAQARTQAAQSKVDTLQAIVASYGNPDDEETKARKKAAETELANAQQELGAAKLAEDAARIAHETAQENEKKAQEASDAALENLNTVKENLENLNKEKQELDKQVEKNCDETTIKARDEYNIQKEALDKAQDDVETAITNKTIAVTQAEDTLATDQAKLDEISALVAEKEREKNSVELEDKFGAGSPDEIDINDLDKYMNKELASKLSESATNNVRYKEAGHAECLGGVDDQFERVFGMRSNKMSAYMLADILASDEGLGQYFGEIKNVTRGQLASLPGGCVVVWDNNANGGGSNVSAAGKKHGHISICLGDGRESSDHIQDQMTDRDSTYRVFYPKKS